MHNSHFEKSDQFKRRIVKDKLDSTDHEANT
jgi:hypothetical protein